MSRTEWTSKEITSLPTQTKFQNNTQFESLKGPLNPPFHIQRVQEFYTDLKIPVKNNIGLYLL